MTLALHTQAEIVERYRNGENRHAISVSLGCGHKAITNALLRNGIQPTRAKSRGRAPTSYSAEIKAEVVARYQGGAACWAITRALRLSYPTVKRILREHGIEPEVRWAIGRGRYITEQGYVMVTLPAGHPHVGMSRRSDRSVREHRLVMAERLGRDLLQSETVHHKNGKRDDNRFENLELMISVHPYGQRAEDKVAFAVEILGRYAPDLLA